MIFQISNLRDVSCAAPARFWCARVSQSTRRRVRSARWGFPTLPCSFRLKSALARVMDKFDLSRKMKRLIAWLDTQNRPDGLAGRGFHGVPFADAYVTIDPERQSPYASANLNRVHLCGTEAGMNADS